MKIITIMKHWFRCRYQTAKPVFLCCLLATFPMSATRRCRDWSFVLMFCSSNKAGQNETFGKVLSVTK